MQTTIDRIDRYPIRVPLREIPDRNMARELLHWRYFEIIEAVLADGSVGYGETMLYYTWGETTDETVERARGSNAVDLMWDDSLGAGLQIALFDAVGTSLGVPVHALLGTQVHEKTPLSWWCIDMPAEDWVAEANRAIDCGYTTLKVKGRPWFDIWGQLEALSETLPEWFEVDVDFNGTLLTAEQGLPLLSELETIPQVSHIEGAIPQTDVRGNRHLTESLESAVALHYDRPETSTLIREQMCDGFVARGGASHLRGVAAVTAMANKPFWLQLVGTDITAAFSLHCGGVFEQATWPGITCHQIYENDLLVDSISVDDGYAAVPDGPGLGYDIDMDAVERFRCELPDERPNPPRLVECDWIDGPTIYLPEGEVNFMIEGALEETMPYFERGVETRLVPNEGSSDWQTLYDRAAGAPVIEDEPVL